MTTTLPWETRSGNALPQDERSWLKDVASYVPSGKLIVNIGVLLGASMYCLRAGAPKARLIGIDINLPPTDLHPSLCAEFIVADSRVCHVSVTVPIVLLFIDGDHHYAVIKEDIANWTPKIVPGGIVAFHDYAPLPRDLAKNPQLEGVRRAVNEWHDREHWIRLKAPDSLAAFKRPK